jgi:hypothetical protein
MQPNRTYAFRIPRMKALINSIYPGTPLSFSEWNAALAGESDFSTALVDVDAWGIFGRENIYATARWIASATTSPAYNSLLLYQNYDGAGHSFGTTSIQATNSGSPNLFSSYASLNAAGTQLTLMLVNKDPSNINIVALQAEEFSPTSVTTYILSQSNPTMIIASPAASPSASVTLPPYSAMLLVANGSLTKAPAAEWDLNPSDTMVPANSSVLLSPKIISGTGTITLSNPLVLQSNPSNNSGITITIPAAQVTANHNGSVMVTAGNTPGFYQIQITGTDSSGVAVTQDGWILVQNPSSTLTKSGDNQTGAPGSTLTLAATLNPGNSGGTITGANIFFSTTAGTLSAREVAVNSSGQASVTLTLPATSGTVTVTAEGQFGLGHPVVTFTETVQ